jgi:thiol-disulfide isomerase/thioredoxin
MLATILLAAATSLAPVLGAPSWANVSGPPATGGRVTVVDVFAFSCINCKHVTPELKKLRAQYGPRDLTIVGVHAPETAEEHSHANLAKALRDQGITWPVVYDDGFQIWSAYGVTAWPTQLVFDRHGVLRATFVGEGFDSELEARVRELAAEPG